MAQEHEIVRQSYLGWIMSSLGLGLAALLLLAGLACALAAFVIVIRGRGPWATASLLLVVHIPFLLGIFGGFLGAINAFIVMGNSQTTPRPSEVAVGISSALVAPIAGLTMMIPGYLIATIGSIVKSLGDERNGALSA